jgi:hypothetical protein
MSTVKVTKSVDVERLFGKVIRNAYHKMAQEAANAAVGRAPVDRGHLKACMMLQHTKDVTYTGNGVHVVAVWKPTEKKSAGKGEGPLEYGAYLDNPTGGTEQVPAGPRTYPGKGPVKGGKKHGKLFGKHKGTWNWPAMTRERAKNPKYLGTPRAGNPTRGWFNPGVVDDLRAGNGMDRIAREAAAELEAGWNK